MAINPKLINTHMANITKSVKAIQQHVGAGFLKIKSSGVKPNPKSEADAGSMKGYDPNLGLGKQGYSRLK